MPSPGEMFYEEYMIESSMGLGHRFRTVRTPSPSIRFAADMRLQSAGFNPNDFTWIGDPEPPEFNEEDTEIVVGICDSLDSLEQSIECQWQWIVRNHNASTCRQIIKFDAAHLRDFRDPGQSLWRPRTRRWFSLNLDTLRAAGVKQARELGCEDSLAGLEIIAAIAQNPSVLMDRMGTNRPWPILSAFDVRDSEDEEWTNSPSILYRRNDDAMLFGHTEQDDESRFFSCPMVF